jgi:hypothetical protein
MIDICFASLVCGSLTRKVGSLHLAASSLIAPNTPTESRYVSYVGHGSMESIKALRLQCTKLATKDAQAPAAS